MVAPFFDSQCIYDSPLKHRYMYELHIDFRHLWVAGYCFTVVCLSVCKQDDVKCYGSICMKLGD